MLRGTIDEFPLIDVLGILRARNKTGRLEIERQAGRGLIYVRLGEPYYAESSLTRSLIGQKLVDIGAISDMQLRKALDRQAESGERLGQILLTHGVISGEHIAAAVISQIKDALADLLAWEAGEFSWEAGAEVEVEVPLFGATIGAIDEGSNPLAPHVVPMTSEEPHDAEAAEASEPGAVSTQPDFTQGGTAMTGDEVTALQHETSPDAGQHPNLEVVDFFLDMHDGAQEDDPPLEAADEPALHEEQEEARPQFEADGDAGVEQPGEPVNEFEAQPEPEPVEEAEPEPVDEFEAQPEPEPDEEFEAEVQPPPLRIDPQRAEPQPVASDEVPFHAPRVIRSQPAPELDEEFERMFQATEAPSLDDEPTPEVHAPEPDIDVDPVFRAENFIPVAPHVDPGFEPPRFEPAAVNPDPLFNPAHFEPIAEPDEDEPVAEDHEPVTEQYEAEPIAEPDEDEPVAEDHEPDAEPDDLEPDAEPDDLEPDAEPDDLEPDAEPDDLEP
ncbi:MAG: DUF4388 domain-containing protein, partial [Actinomycetota bacterium]